MATFTGRSRASTLALPAGTQHIDGNLAADISTAGTLTISDLDSPQSFLAQPATIGTYGTFAIDAAGAWTYTASAAHNEFAAGATYSDTFAVQSADGTLTAVTIHIAGTNDAAILSADVASLTETNLAADKIGRAHVRTPVTSRPRMPPA